LECAGSGREILVALGIGGQEKGFVEMNVWVAEGGEEEWGR